MAAIRRSWCSSHRPVGYHAWIDSRNLALFVLGKPNALVHANVVDGRA